MSDILCVYYSRTGRTEKAMGEIAQALGAELVKIEDGQDRSKLRGYLRSGLEAMSKKLCPHCPPCRRSGRSRNIAWSSSALLPGRAGAPAPSRAFWPRMPGSCPRFPAWSPAAAPTAAMMCMAHMATFLKRMRLTDVSLRPDDAGYEFWRDKFIQDTKNALGL